jgi:FkbM family methyltransferase
MIHHTWELGIQKLLTALVKPGKGSFIDVGANVGLTLIPMGMAYPELKLIGIEADEENFGYLRRNVDRSGLTGITLYNRAVYSSDGEVEFERSEKNAGDHRVRGEGPRDLYGESGRQVIRVKCNRIDSLIDPTSLNGPVGMKCDVQGSEVHFFKGAETILTVVDWLVVEYWPYGIARVGTCPDEFFEILALHFSYGGIVEDESMDFPTLMPVANLALVVAARLRREGETAHCDIVFSKTNNPLTAEVA